MAVRSCVTLSRNFKSCLFQSRGYVRQNIVSFLPRSSICAKSVFPNVILPKLSPIAVQTCCFSTNKDSSVGEEKKVSLYEKLKLMYKDYWYVLVPVHVVTSTMWYGGFYYMIVSGVDIASIMEYVGTPDSWVENVRSSKAGAFVAAYTLYKLATPARYTVTLGGTTISINYLKKWGWIKPIPNKEQLKIIYNEKKDALKDLKTTYQDKMQVTKEEIKDEFIKTSDCVKQQYTEAKHGMRRSMKESRQDMKEGLHHAAMEWTHIGRLTKRAMVESIREKYKLGGNKKND